MKVLFDSNVYISDAIFHGSASQAITATLHARWRIYACDTVLNEVNDVLRTKFRRNRNFARTIVDSIRTSSKVVDEPHSKHQVELDPDDTPILRAAIGAKVDYLVTGDAVLLNLKQVEGIRIIRLSDYLHILQSHGIVIQ